MGRAGVQLGFKGPQGPVPTCAHTVSVFLTTVGLSPLSHPDPETQSRNSQGKALIGLAGVRGPELAQSTVSRGLEPYSWGGPYREGSCRVGERASALGLESQP